jgi:uncharacterized SAM-binding protein YcdF (DUF218 family)
MLFHRHYLVKEKHFGNIRVKHQTLKLILITALSISGWFGYRTMQGYLIKPEAVFVLGGHEAREKFAANLAQQDSHLEIWVSSGSPQNYVQQIFAFRGISSDRLHLDYQAEDTVTNFTTIVDKLKANGIQSVYLVTSDNHMTRARIVGEIVFGSRGIAIQPIAVPSQSPPEPPEKCLRDSARAILWLATGYTGSTWKNKSVIE